MIETGIPKVFISYSWDDDEHREWVCNLADRLRKDGIEIILDQWHAKPGDQLPVFMEKAVRESEFVLCICTPKYKMKSDMRGGGVGYEGDIMTAEYFVNHNQRKFIPILRRAEWREAAPSWLLGKYYVDLRGDPYNEKNYMDLLTTLLNEREFPPKLDVLKDINNGGVEFEFVNRSLELATFNPGNLENSYWQWALVSAPTGYGKSHLLKRLMLDIDGNELFKKKWNYRCIDLRACTNTVSMVGFIGKAISGKDFLSSHNVDAIRQEIRNYVLDEMSIASDGGPSRGILLIFDHLDDLPHADIPWLSALLNDVITGSYIDYRNIRPAFPVRIILSGIDTEFFLKHYKEWEKSASCEFHLRSPEPLPLSAFKKTNVEELISRRAKNIPLGDQISDIADKLLYLSGGHPAIINGILDELIVIKFRQYDRYLKDNHAQLIKNHVSPVVRRVLNQFPLRQAQQDIKTICVFRLIQLNVLQSLKSQGLIIPSVDDNTKFLGTLSNGKIFNLDKRIPFYRDDIMRRILYLDFAFGSDEYREHIQKAHKCALDYYSQKLCKKDIDQLSSYYIESLFHMLQMDEFSAEKIIAEWKKLLSGIRSTSVIPDDLKKVIQDEIEMDSELRYLCCERFGLEYLSHLFQF